MSAKLPYRDVATFYSVESGNYANSKQVVVEAEIKGIMLQATAFTHAQSQDLIDSDAIFYPDPSSVFVKNNNNILEGMYIKCKLFGVDENKAWYKIDSVVVNRHHLLSNRVDNIELRLSKARPIGGN